MPINAIRNPPAAWPKMEPESHEAERMVAAGGSISLGTIRDIIAPKIGPEKARITPVIAMIVQIIAAMVQLLKSTVEVLDDRNINNKIHPAYKSMQVSNNFLFSDLSI